LILHLVHHYLITQAQLSDLIPVFEVADSSTRGISQIFKGGRAWRIRPTYTRGQGFVSLLFLERERERERTRDWVLGGFFPTETD